MAKKAKKVSKAKKSTAVNVDGVPVVDLLGSTATYLALLYWIGAHFNQRLVVAIPEHARMPPPPAPGECGEMLSAVSVGSLMEVIEQAHLEVSTVLYSLVGPCDVPPLVDIPEEHKRALPRVPR